MCFPEFQGVRGRKGYENRVGRKDLNNAREILISAELKDGADIF